MGLPKQVEEAAALAEELHGRMFSSSDPVEENEEDKQETEPEVASEPEEEPQPEEAAEEKKEDEETYKARYFTLKGMYDADVPRLHKELKELKSKVFERLGDMTAPKTTQATSEPDPLAEKLAKYREEYGDDLIEMQRLIVKSEVAPLLKQQLEPVQEQVNEVSAAQIKVAQKNFQDYLDSKVEGDWRNLWSEDNPKFVEFLEQKDPYGIYTYGQLVDKFNTDWDANGLAAVFNLFLKGQQPSQPAPEVQRKAPAPNPAQEALVAPSRSTQPTPPVVEDKRIWTSEMIREFERADRMGKYDAETSQAMWQDLLAAPGENRIRNK